MCQHRTPAPRGTDHGCRRPRQMLRRVKGAMSWQRTTENLMGRSLPQWSHGVQSWRRRLIRVGVTLPRPSLHLCWPQDLGSRSVACWPARRGSCLLWAAVQSLKRQINHRTQAPTQWLIHRVSQLHSLIRTLRRQMHRRSIQHHRQIQDQESCHHHQVVRTTRITRVVIIVVVMITKVTPRTAKTTSR